MIMQQIKSIHYLRGIAAFLVVGFHVRNNFNDIYPIKNLGDFMFMSGASGVDLFFIISGFIMMYSTSIKVTPSDFIVRRIFRIFPPFLFLLTALYFLYPDFKTEHVMRSIFLIHSDYSSDAPFFGYNTLIPAWTLTYEVYFYLIFAISMTLSQKYRGLISIIALVLPVVLLQLIINGDLDLYGAATAELDKTNPLYGFVRFVSSPMMIELCYGIIFYSLSKYLKNIRHYELIAFASISFFVCSYLSWFRFFHGPINFGLWALILILGALIYESNKQLKNIPLLTFMGNISYSLYLTQGVVLTVLNHYEPYIPIYSSGKGFVRFVFSLSTCIVVAYFIYHYIEYPSIQIGKKFTQMIKRRKLSLA